MHGDGQMLFRDGMRYEGQYVKDKKSGTGQFIWPDGRMYSGEWSSGKQHGIGTYTDANGLSWTGGWFWGRKVDQRTGRPASLKGLGGMSDASTVMSDTSGVFHSSYDGMSASSSNL